MTRILTGGALLAALASALLLSGCFEGTNTSCSSDCFSMNFPEGTNQAEIDAKIKRACEGMGKTGTPQVLERTPTVVAGHCT